jgi:DNA-directed RNA polymerase specialized sigma subunit|tara:strand:- start:128 stop:295 length:168 start_codon:yes stop_codon:yes gene_type:complete
MTRGTLSNNPAWGRGVLGCVAEKGWTQEEIAKWLGCSQANVSYWARKLNIKTIGM